VSVAGNADEHTAEVRELDGEAFLAALQALGNG
jgi:hypothetical protein